jgi:hypothetical protein
MSETTKPVNFTLSGSAKRYLQGHLAHLTEAASARRLVTCLTFSGGARVEKDGRTLWDYSGPCFTIAGIKPESLGEGGYFDLLGHRVWISRAEEYLLSRRTLTTQMVGTDSPDPGELLVIENAPEGYFEQILRLRDGKW